MSAISLWSNPYAVLPLPQRDWKLPAPSCMNDRDLVNRCIAGDGAAWEEVLRLHSRRVFNLCLRFTGRAEDAEDLAQDVFVRLFRSFSSFRPEAGSLATWLTTLTRNLLIDHYRRSKADRLTDSIESENADGELVPLPLPAAGRAADATVYSNEVHQHVQRCLVRLSPELREAVILRDLQDMSYSEIATVLRLPEGTVKSRINRGRLELARLLRPTLGHSQSTESTQ